MSDVDDPSVSFLGRRDKLIIVRMFSQATRCLTRTITSWVKSVDISGGLVDVYKVLGKAMLVFQSMFRMRPSIGIDCKMFKDGSSVYFSVQTKREVS